MADAPYAIQREQIQGDLTAPLSYDTGVEASADNELPTKGYLDSKIVVSSWKNPSAVLRLYGVANDEPMSNGQQVLAGDAYIVGTPWGGFVAGDVVERSGSSTWVKILSGSGGKPPDGMHATIGPTTAKLLMPFSAGAENYYADYRVLGDTWNLAGPVGGDAQLINGAGGYFKNKLFVYDAAISLWIEFPAPFAEDVVIAALFTTANVGPTIAGAVCFDPRNYPGKTIRFVVVGSLADDNYEVTVALYDITDSGGVISFNVNTMYPERFESDPLTLDAARHIYAARIEVSGTTGTIYSAMFEIRDS